MPLSRPGSANTSASACLYIGNKKDHCSQPRLSRHQMRRPPAMSADRPATSDNGCCASSVALPRTLPPAVLGAPLPAMSIVCRWRWGPVISRVQPVITPPPSRLRQRPNSDHAGKSTYSGEIESLDRDPGIETLVPGMPFPGN